MPNQLKSNGNEPKRHRIYTYIINSTSLWLFLLAVVQFIHNTLVVIKTCEIVKRLKADTEQIMSLCIRHDDFKTFKSINSVRKTFYFTFYKTAIAGVNVIPAKLIFLFWIFCRLLYLFCFPCNSFVENRFSVNTYTEGKLQYPFYFE